MENVSPSLLPLPSALNVKDEPEPLSASHVPTITEPAAVSSLLTDSGAVVALSSASTDSEAAGEVSPFWLPVLPQL